VLFTATSERIPFERKLTIASRPDHAEHSRVGADAQPQGHDDGDRQPLVASELPERKLQVRDDAHRASYFELLNATRAYA
jgi:hypothetical protein